MPNITPDLENVTEQVRIFFHKHRVRIIGAAVIAIAAAMLIATSSSDPTLRLVFLGPLIVGACIPLASQDIASDAINGWGAYFARSLKRAQGRKGKFSRYFSLPLHWGSLTLWSLSESIQDGHIRAGVRLSTIVYFWAVMIFALVVTVYIIVVVVVAIIILALVGWFLSLADSDPRRPKPSGDQSDSRSKIPKSFFSFSTKCGNCKSKEHATRDCPHGFFSEKCGNCGGKDHATRDCPHGFFSSKCGHCGSKEHATRDCPH